MSTETNWKEQWINNDVPVTVNTFCDIMDVFLRDLKRSCRDNPKELKGLYDWTVQFLTQIDALEPIKNGQNITV